MPGRIYSSGTSYRYGFNGQERSSELHDNSYAAQFWEYDTRIGRRWNKDPRPNISMSMYSAFSNNPIWFSDPLGDTAKIYGNAEVTNTTLLDKGGVNESASKAITYNDAQINPVYGKDGKTLVGYNVYDKTNPGLGHPILQLETEAELASFKMNYKWQFGGAQLYYANGEPSEGFKKMSASLDIGSYKLAIDGAMQENKEFWTNPQKAIPTLLAWGHAGIAYVESTILNNARNSISKSICLFR